MGSSYTSCRHKPFVLQAAAAADIAGKADIFTAIQGGNLELVFRHLIADPACVNQCGSWYEPRVATRHRLQLYN